MKNISYQGPHQSVVIPLASGIVYACDLGGDVEVPDELAAELIARGDWKSSKLTKPIKQPNKGKE